MGTGTIPASALSSAAPSLLSPIAIVFQWPCLGRWAALPHRGERSGRGVLRSPAARPPSAALPEDHDSSVRFLLLGAVCGAEEGLGGLLSLRSGTAMGGANAADAPSGMHIPVDALLSSWRGLGEQSTR
jgi:hypothetical protein